MPNEPGFIPPHSIEAEQAVLGAIFVDPGCLPEVTLILKKPEMFWRTSHQHIYKAIQDLSGEGHEIDWVSVGEQVRTNGVLDECGGKDALHTYLSDISHSVPSAYGAERYARARPVTDARDHPARDRHPRHGPRRNHVAGRRDREA